MIHGKKRENVQQSAQELQKLKEITSRVNSALQFFFKLRRGQAHCQSPFQQTTSMLKLCPQIPTVYNLRRQLIVDSLKEKSKEESIKLFSDQILITTKLIKQNPKSYTIWTYRQWLVVQLEQIGQDPFSSELKLCQKMLSLDDRNFHVWNYRHWLISQRKQKSWQKQLDFLEKMLQKSPSNFSCYHFKINIYIDLFRYRNFEAGRGIQFFSIPQEIFFKETQLIKQLIFIDPKENGPWHYYDWLLSLVTPIAVTDVQIQDKKLKLTFNKPVNSPKRALGIQTSDYDCKEFRMIWYVQLQSNSFLLKGGPDTFFQAKFGGKIIKPVKIDISQNKVTKQQGQLDPITYKVLRNEIDFLNEIQKSQWRDRLLKAIN